MALPLLLLGLTAGAGIGTGMYVFRSGAESKDLKPTLFGVPAVPALTVGGLLMAVMGGGLLGPIGLGVAIGSLVGGSSLSQAKAGLDAAIQRQIAAATGGAPGSPALPGPTMQPTPQPQAAPGGGWLSWLFPAGAQPQTTP